MAQGVRILSNNLNGKTGSVTFLPASGGTIDLGYQTLPFTYMTSYPYGEYQINVTEYSHTYSLMFPAPSPLQSAYTTTVTNVFPNAVLSEDWGIYTNDFIENKGFPPNTIVYAEGICADDVDAPKYMSINNIGQFPTSMNTFLGPFMSGGLAGYPFVGTVGLGAWASHIATTSGGTLFITSMPHIGITQSQEVGKMLRRGKVDATTDSTCGAVAGAISVTLAASAPPQLIDWDGNFQFFTLLEILWPYQSVLAGMTYGDAMLFATETIRDAAYDFIINNLPAQITGVTTNDVFFCSGIFINTDDTYSSYVAIDKFEKYVFSSSTWVDMSAEYLGGLL